MKRVRLLSLILILMLTSFAVLALAQSSDAINCEALEEADCTALTSALDALPDSSFVAENFTYNLGGPVPALPSAGPVILDENGVIQAFDLSDETGFQSLYLDSVLYLRDDESAEWTAESADAEAVDFMNAVLRAVRAAPHTRSDDTDLDGQSMLVFQSQSSAADLLGAGNALANFVNGLVTTLPGDFEASLPAVGSIFTRDSLNLTLWVGADDNLLHRIMVTAEVDGDLSAFNADPISLQGNGEMTLTQHGPTDAVTITAPEDIVLSGTSISLGSAFSNVTEGSNPNRADGLLTYGQTLSALWSDYTQLWAFEGEAGDVVTITVRAELGLWDPILALRLENGTETLAFVDNPETPSAALSPYDPIIENFELPESGRYFVLVTGAGTPANDPYEISLEVQP